ncbi:putative peptidoglycan binding domain protein [bacterium BMS3Bbin10]|nr:putative peptidoglycan binding domain protein [bacterium BMS3Bbin10]
MLFAFVGLAAAITYNAIFLQTGRHPAPISIDAEDSGTHSAIKNRKKSVTTRTLPQVGKRAALLPRSQTILAIQRKLKEDGYEPGPVDGVFGHMTRAAIMAYQHDQGLPVTGEGSSQLLKTMIFGTTAGASGQGASSPVSKETKALVRAVQKSLTKLGYKPGPADGVWGAATRKAIERFERDRKLDVKGRISGRLMKELVRATGSSLAIVISG